MAAILTGRLALAGAAVAGLLALALVLFWPRQPAAPEFRVGDITVGAPWARATPGTSRIGAAYLTLVNRGASPDRLLRAETAVAERIELHNTTTEDAVMRMRPLESVALPPGQPVQFAPGGLHLMLVNLAAPLEDGKSFELRLGFERAGSLSVTVPISAIGAAAPAADGHGAHHGGHGADHGASHGAGHGGH